MKKYRPITPGLRFRATHEFDGLTKKKPEKSLCAPLVRKAGRNGQGRITSSSRGGGHKRRYRLIDFRRNKLEVPGRIASIEYDPNRTARIALVNYLDGEKRYILAPNGLTVGQEIISTNKEAEIISGNSLLLKNIPAGTQLHNIELKPGKGAQLVRSAGTSAQLVGKEEKYGLLRLPSGEMRKVLLSCRATIGQVGNEDHENVVYGKAGVRRWLGRRPHTRGTAMNPVDHPHGGGQGSDRGGRIPVTPWGVPTKGYKTRSNKTTSKYIVRRRKK